MQLSKKKQEESKKNGRFISFPSRLLLQTNVLDDHAEAS